MDRRDIKQFAEDGNAQASLILTIGPALWKLISNISNVDFLLGLNGEKFNIFFNFLEGPGWAIAMAIGAVWFVAQVAFRPYVRQRSGPTWALLLSSNIMAFLFGILVAVNSTGGVPSLFTSWGSTDPRLCLSQVDTNKLLSFAKAYKLAIVCGLQDPTKDKLENEFITVSSRFTITSGAQQVATQTSNTMAQKVGELIQAAKESSGNPTVNVALPIWYEVILLPNDVPTSKVSKLGDVLILGGKILDSQYFR